MSQLILNSQASTGPVSNHIHRFQIGPVSTLLFMMLAIAIMAVVSLAHLNSMSTKGYTIKKLEDDSQVLISDGELNDALLLQARSLQTIQNDPHVQRMVQPDAVYYMPSMNTGFAQVEGS